MSMEFNPFYPRDFQLALNNTLSEEDVTLFLTHLGSSRHFVYGILMLPTVLKYYTDADQGCRIDKCMTQATLSGYELYQFAASGAPVIAPSCDPKATVQGMLVFNLDEHQRNAIYELEGGLTSLESVQVDIFQKGHRDHLRKLPKVDAGTFVWAGSKEGLAPVKSAAWSVDGFLRSPLYRHISESQYRSASGLGESTEDGHQGSSINNYRNYTALIVRSYECSLYRIEEEAEPAG